MVPAISAYLDVETEETTGTTKTVSVGLVGGTGAEFLSGESVAAAGPVGTPIGVAYSAANISYTLGSADFAELDATLVITLVQAE